MVTLVRRGGALFVSCALVIPFIASAEIVQCVNSYAGTQIKRYELPAGTLDPGPNQHNTLTTNSAAAKQDIDKTFFTTELTSFNDSQCSDGPCRNNIPGIAHRSWPLNSCVTVCNIQNRRCAVAIVMDRGPNTNLRCRTIDANPALQAALGMQGGTVQASYQLKSLPPQTCQTTAVPGFLGGSQTSVSSAGLPGYSPFGAGLAPGVGAYPIQPAYPSQGAYPSQTPIAGAQTSPLSMSPTPVSSQLGTEGTGSTQSGPVVGDKSALVLIIQPLTVVSGGTALVSWTSVNMRPGSCKVTKNDTTLAQEPQGTSRETLTVAGTVEYALECIAPNGETVRSSTSVSVQ